MKDEERLEAIAALHCVGLMEAGRIMRLEDRNKKPALRPEDLPTFNKPFKPVIMDYSKPSNHWKRGLAEFRKKAPRWASPLYAKAMSEDIERAPEFNQKAVQVLHEEGHSGPAIASILGISLRAARGYLTKPCPALEAECNQTKERARQEHFAKTEQGTAPFDIWAYLSETKPPIVVDLLGFDPWDVDISTTKEKVTFYLSNGWTPAEISRVLPNVSPQAIAKHVKAIRERVEIDTKKRVAMNKRHRRKVVQASTKGEVMKAIKSDCEAISNA